VLRISRLTDYGTVVLAHLARDDAGLVSAAEVASATGIALPTVSKLLKSLAKAEIVTSTRGPHGGYRLARDARAISAADVQRLAAHQCRDSARTGRDKSRRSPSGYGPGSPLRVCRLADAGLPITIEVKK
jgi:Rrf2 family protein